MELVKENLIKIDHHHLDQVIIKLIMKRLLGLLLEKNKEEGLGRKRRLDLMHIKFKVLLASYLIMRSVTKNNELYYLECSLILITYK